jgi:enoyl-CoA hydratase/carnithine racemase
MDICEETPVLCSIHGKVATITLNRPKVLNAINGDVRRGFLAHLQALEANDDVQVIVLTGAGRSFCAGNDLRQARASEAGNEYYQLYSAIRKSTKVVIAKIHGHCAGAGLQISLLADMRIAAHSAKIGMVEFNVGLPVLIGSGLLSAVCGDAAMRRIILLADFVGGEEAVRLNMATEAVADDQLDARVGEIAASIASRSPNAIRITKQCWSHFTEVQFEATMAYARDVRSKTPEASTTILPENLQRP